ncbi:MAG: Uncharacterised protein [Cellulomonadaceae bacterium TMED98]|nr:MAG: Uncharacterised protein [Cellulomonadaceae bacterium TMED98]
MVGGDNVDGPIGDSFPKSLHIIVSAKGWIDFVERVIAGREVFGQQEMVRSNFCGDGNPLGFCPADNLHRTRRGEVADV